MNIPINNETRNNSHRSRLRSDLNNIGINYNNLLSDIPNNYVTNTNEIKDNYDNESNQ